MSAQHRLVAEALVSGYGNKTIVDSVDLELPAGRITVMRPAGSSRSMPSTIFLPP